MTFDTESVGLALHPANDPSGLAEVAVGVPCVRDTGQGTRAGNSPVSLKIRTESKVRDLDINDHLRNWFVEKSEWERPSEAPFL